MNREIMGRQMFAQGGQVYPMQEGGAMHQMPDGSMMPDSAMPAPQGPAPQMPGMMARGDQGGMDINAAAEGAMQNGIDPTVLEGMLGNYASQMEDLDNAQDYETVMNGIRGDQVPVEGRYAELAEIVGPEDAQATPESVLTLIQPIMQMAAVDQGIGGLAQDEMNAPIEGAMAEGIMSTVNMGAPEGPAPVNFNQGGAVHYMAPGGVVPSGLQSSFDERQSLYNSIIGPQAYDQVDIDAERDMTQAQMLFDVAGTALAFATPGDRQMSPGQRLAQAATDTQLFEKIGARAKDQMTTDRGRKKDMRDEKMKIDLMALQSAEAQELQKAKAASTAASSGTQNFFNAEGKIVTTLKGSPEFYNAIRLGFTATGPVSQSADDKTKGVNFQNQTTGDLSTFVQGSPEALAAINDPNMVLTGNASQSTEGQDTPINFISAVDGSIKTVVKGSSEAKKLIEDENWTYTGTTSQTPLSTARVTLYNATTDETLNPLASDPNIDDLLKEGFERVTTPSRPTTPKLDARTLFVTDSARLTAYGDGTLDPSETAQFEQIIGEMQMPSTTTIQGQQVTSPSKPLSGPLLKAIRNRMSGGYETTSFNLPEKEDNTSDAILSLREQPDTGAVITALQDYRSKDKGTLPRDIINSPEFNSTLLDESGRTDLSSESWRMIPTQIYKAGVNYDVARGVSTIPDRVATAFNEVARDVTGGRVSAEGLMIYQADNDFKALKTLTKGRLTSAVTEGRVLKSVQDDINEFLDPLQPGVFKFDAKARASLNSIAGILATSLDDQVEILPEFGGNPSDYSNTDIQNARKTARQLKNLLTEYVQFGDQMDTFLSGRQGVGGTVGQGTVQQNRNVLYKEAQKQQGGGN